jgi:hypothetical protein
MNQKGTGRKRSCPSNILRLRISVNEIGQHDVVLVETGIPNLLNVKQGFEPRCSAQHCCSTWSHTGKINECVCDTWAFLYNMKIKTNSAGA